MFTWRCALCGEVVSVAFEYNLPALKLDHKQVCRKVHPKEWLLTKAVLTARDVKFLEELKVGW